MLLDEERVVYLLPKPQRDGTTALTLTPLELIDHLAAQLVHRLATAQAAPPSLPWRARPNSPLRAAAIVYGRDATEDPNVPAEVASPPAAPAPNARSPARYLWAMRLARLFESLPLTCPNCGTDRRIIAFVTDAAPVERILTHSGEPPRPPPSPLPVDRPTGSRRPSRPRTGTSSPNQTPVWRLTNVSSGNRRRLSWTAPAPISLP